MRILPAARLGLVAMALTLPGGALADTVYRWVDERGVVHFADVPPPGTRDYEAARMPAAPPRPTQVPAPALPPGAAPAATAPAAAAKGPARVSIAEREELPVGDTTHTFRGTVKNEGGAVARDVAIAVRVVELNQGDECLSDEIDVSPSTLEPGEEGTFETDLSHPCFAGETRAELRVSWE